MEPTHGKPGLHANDDRHDALLVDLRLRGQVLEALPFGEFGDAELEDEGSRQGEGGGRIPALGYAEVGVRRNEGRDLLEVYGPADVVEIEEHGLDEEGQVRAAPPGAPVAAEPPAPLALAAPLRLPGSRLPPKALRAGRFGTRRVVAGMARRPRAPGKGPSAHQGDCGPGGRLHLHAGRHFVAEHAQHQEVPGGKGVGRGEGTAGMVDGEELRAVSRRAHALERDLEGIGVFGQVARVYPRHDALGFGRGRESHGDARVGRYHGACRRRLGDDGPGSLALARGPHGEVHDEVRLLDLKEGVVDGQPAEIGHPDLGLLRPAADDQLELGRAADLGIGKRLLLQNGARGSLVEDIDGRILNREQGPRAGIESLKVYLRLVDVLADEILDLVDDRAATDGKLNAATRLDDRAGGRALLHDLAPFQGIVGKAQRDAGVELLFLHFDQGLRQIHAPHVGHHRLLGAAEREEEGREARDDHEGYDRPEGVGDEPVMLLVEGLDLAEVHGKGGETDFGQLGQLWKFRHLEVELHCGPFPWRDWL